MRPMWTMKSHLMRLLALRRMSSKSLASMCASLNSTAVFLVAMMMSRGFVEFDANAVNARKGAGIFNEDSSYLRSLSLGSLVFSMALSMASSVASSVHALHSRMWAEARLGVIIVDVGVVASAAVSSPFPLVRSSAPTERRSSSSVVLQCMIFLSKGMVTVLLAVARH